MISGPIRGRKRDSTVTLQFAIARSEWNCVPPASHSLQKEPCLRHTGMRSGTRTPARSERPSSVHSECDGVRRRRAYRPTETDGQVCLDEVSFEQAVVMLDGPAF